MKLWKPCARADTKTKQQCLSAPRAVGRLPRGWLVRAGARTGQGQGQRQEQRQGEGQQQQQQQQQGRGRGGTER